MLKMHNIKTQNTYKIYDIYSYSFFFLSVTIIVLCFFILLKIFVGVDFYFWVMMDT